MRITEDEFFDYVRCPIHYHSIHVLKMPFRTPPSFTKCLDKVALAFMTNLMNGRVMPTGDLKRKWDRVCGENRGRINESKCIEGIKLLSKMFFWARSKKLRIADINTPYEMLITGPHGKTSIKGEISTVAVNLKDQFEIFSFDFSRKYPDQSMLDMSMKYTLDCLAFEVLFKKETGIHIHHVDSNNDYFSFRSNDDRRRLATAIDSVAFSIKNNIFYPRESAFCSTCGIKDLCRMWACQAPQNNDSKKRR